MPLTQWLLLLAAVPWALAFIPGADGPITWQEALEGGSTTLRCDASTPEPGDELMLLVWYKNYMPIYSFDARIQQEWCSDTFNRSGRVAANLTARPTELTVHSLAEADHALYHCRVDFSIAQTRNLAVNLTITVLPSQPFFLDELGNKVETKVGPYHDGDTLVLSCLVIGGNPPPRIRWYSGDTLVDNTDGPSDIPNVRENELYLRLDREHAASLSCSATNTDLAAPIVSTVDVELFLPPSSVTVSLLGGVAGPGGALLAGRAALARCEARGSRPPPDISWWLGATHLTHHSNQSYTASTDETVSFLSWTPAAADSGAALACVATNPAMAPARGLRSHTVTLNVTYSPIVEVKLVDNYKDNEVIELDPLHLECHISANPPVHTITWYCNDTVIQSDSGTAMALASLRQPESERAMSGRYACAAANTVGETRAQPVDVAVLYPPTCLSPGVSRAAETVTCHVESRPAPDTYFWHVMARGGEPQNLTTGSKTLPLSQLLGSLESPVHVFCSASNGVSSQDAPCSAALSLRDLRPPSLTQCDLAYEEEEFYVRCIPVENATHYEASLWRLSLTNTSLLLERRAPLAPTLPAGAAQARAAAGGVAGEGDGLGTGAGGLLRAGLGRLRAGDEAAAAACNRYGCAAPLLLRPTDTLLYAAQVPWWHFFLERDVGISIGAVVLMAAFVTSTILAIRLARRPRGKAPPVVQVLQLDDVAREYIDQALEHKLHASCSLRSCSSGYSGGSVESAPPPPPPADRRRKPHYYWEPQPPDVTLTLHRESAV